MDTDYVKYMLRRTKNEENIRFCRVDSASKIIQCHIHNILSYFLWMFRIVCQCLSICNHNIDFIIITGILQRNFEASIPVGFFCYPISQAADITAFRATTVPVGEDQLPMLEQCKEIVHKFNSVYGETLTEPDIILPSNKACLRLPGIDGKAKMSKSLGNCIYLSDEAEDIKKKVMSMFTDPNHLRVEDPGQVEGNTVFIYLDAFCKQDYVDEFLPDYANLEELKEHYKRGGLGDVKVKKFLNNVMQAELAPIRERRKSWEKRLPDVYDILKEGSKVAEAKAAETLRDVKNSMKINYFEDPDFLK